MYWRTNFQSLIDAKKINAIGYHEETEGYFRVKPLASISCNRGRLTGLIPKPVFDRLLPEIEKLFITRHDQPEEMIFDIPARIAEIQNEIKAELAPYEEGSHAA